MPTILTPPEIDRRHREPGEGDGGSGRRPPTDKRTGGNGDGDNWDDRPQGRRGPRERLSRARVGVFFGLAVVAMFFVAIVCVFLVTKAAAPVVNGRVMHNWVPIAIPRVLILNTLVLLVSSVTAEMARRSMFHEADVMDEWIGLGRPTSNRATAWLAATLTLGVMFLAGQWMAWKQLAAERVFSTVNPSRSLFYLITETHAAHLVLGVGLLVAALIVLQRSRLMATRQVFVDGTVWYWHAMGTLWVMLFLLLEFGQ